MAGSKPIWPELKLPPINLWVLAAWREAPHTFASRPRTNLSATMFAARASLLPLFYTRRARCL